VVAALPKVAREDRLAEIAAAPDLPPLDEADLQQLRDLYDAGFGVKGRA
jgi:diketogulonate reductase-like aldo/keto reductase